MTTKRKHLKAPLARSASTKQLAPCETRDRGYPRLAELLGEPALASVLRGAVLGGAALSAVALSGCEPPECQPTRLGEISSHGSQGFSLLARFEPRSSATEFAVGFGLTPHPASYMMAGEMTAVMPTPLPVTPAPSTPPPVPAPSGPVVPAPQE